MGDITLTKAELLERLKGRLRNSIVDDLIYFTVAEWQSNPCAVLDKIVSFFTPEQLLIVRSSARDEDHSYGALAGHYHTEMGVSSGDRGELTHAINKVVESFSREKRSLVTQDQILVQSQLHSVAYSGVVLTREPKRNAPYYVIGYDDITSRTDTVTKGMVGKALWVARWQVDPCLPHPWDYLLFAVQELEQVFPSRVLAIEFGIDDHQQVHIFQVRRIEAYNLEVGDDMEVEKTVGHLQLHVRQLTSSTTSALAGRSTILADMPDWNPAEMLGSRPNFLDYSLYRFLITQSAWNQARVTLGYTDVAPAELMVCLADKPYIDARVSFNSLTPHDLPSDFKAELIDYYLDKLVHNPALQDKVEFEIVLTCFDLSWDTKYPDLLGSGFSKSALDEFKQRLLSFTNDLLLRSGIIMRRDIKTVRQLNKMGPRPQSGDVQELLNGAYQLLIDCRDFGVIPFARLARLAFIGLAILKNLLKSEVVTKEFFDGFLGSVGTVAKRMAADARKLSRGEISEEDFMSRYGHLRPGTYNVLSPRYDHRPDWFAAPAVSQVEPNLGEFVPNEVVMERINKVLEGYGLRYPAQLLLDFIRRAIEYREYAKFVFTKNLSDALETLALVGEMLGFSRAELALLDLETLMSPRTQSLEPSHIRDSYADVVNSNREKKKLYRRVALPPVISDPLDLVLVPYYECYPNYVTDKQVEGETCVLTPTVNVPLPDITGKIVLIENADPGYDWIFARQPKGLITKYGGAGSHMAVRCAEFGLPAAVGCGEIMFKRITTSSRVLLDCQREAIVPIGVDAMRWFL